MTTQRPEYGCNLWNLLYRDTHADMWGRVLGIVAKILEEDDMSFEQYRNPNGTYNGVKAMSDLSGLSEAEVLWTFNRIKHLIQVDKMPRLEAVAKVKEEGKSKPWEQKG